MKFKNKPNGDDNCLCGNSCKPFRKKCKFCVEADARPDDISIDVPVNDIEPLLDDNVLLKKRGDPYKYGKALIIGINYTGTDSELKGCINDALNMYAYLIKVEKYNPKMVRMLIDEPNAHPTELPTRKNIISGIRWLVNGNPMGEDRDLYSLFLHYSGHGSWVWDRNSDEIDRKDETICPLDYRANGLIVDDVLRKEILAPIADAGNIHLTALFDCCHSGTILDMRYNVRVKLCPKKPDTSTIRIKEDKHYKKSKCRIIVFSGCMDKQYSADAYIARQSQGMMTYAFLNVLKHIANQNKKLTYKKFITQIQSYAKNNGYDQIPQLSFNRYVDLKETFTI